MRLDLNVLLNAEALLMLIFCSTSFCFNYCLKYGLLCDIASNMRYLFEQMFTFCINLYCEQLLLSIFHRIYYYLWSRLFELYYDTKTATRNSCTLQITHGLVCKYLLPTYFAQRSKLKKDSDIWKKHYPNLKHNCSCIYNSHCCRLSSFSILFSNKCVIMFCFVYICFEASKNS